MFFKHILRKNSMLQYLLFNCELTSPTFKKSLPHPLPTVYLSLTLFPYLSLTLFPPPANLSLLSLTLPQLCNYLSFSSTWEFISKSHPLPNVNLSLGLTLFQLRIYLSVSPSSNCEFISRSHPFPSVIELTSHNSPAMNLRLSYLTPSAPYLSSFNYELISHLLFNFELISHLFPSGILSPTFFSTLNCSLWLSILYIYLSMGYF
jgi:hypothetical protein